MQTKTRVLDIRLTIKDEELFRKKAKPYQGNMSAMIRDAVSQFDDRATIGKIDALTDMMKLYRKYQQDLSWLGGNFNQAMKQANEIAISGKLSAGPSGAIFIKAVLLTLRCVNAMQTNAHTRVSELKRIAINDTHILSV